MKVTFDTETIKTISLFQNLTGCHVVDTAEENGELYFVVGEGEYGLAVGKEGSKIKNAEKVFKKSIKVFEYSTDLEQFIKNLIPESQQTSIKDNTVRVKIKPRDRAKVIGKGGSKVRVLGNFLKRLFDVEDFKVI